MNLSLRHRRLGMTLVETLIATAIGSLMIAGVCGFIYFDSVSKAALLNYIELNQESMQALDKMSSELREMRRMTEYSTNKIVIENADTNSVTYEFVEGDKTLYRDGAPFLENCYEATFRIYKATIPPFGTNNFDSCATDDPALCKLILLQWSCERNISSTAQRHTESVQTAKIVLRN